MPGLYTNLVARAALVLAVGVLALSASSRPSKAEARMACNLSYCSESCSLLNCLAHAGCQAAGSCAWDEGCNGPKVTCFPDIE